MNRQDKLESMVDGGDRYSLVNYLSRNISNGGRSGRMNWPQLFASLVKNESDMSLTFYDPITEDKLRKIKEVTGIEISGELLELLSQTDGIKENRFGDYWIYGSEQIIECHERCLVYFEESDFDLKSRLLFADNGCGDYFGYMVKNAKIISSQIGYFEPISPDEFTIVSPDLHTWATKWHSGTLFIYGEEETVSRGDGY